MYIPMEVLHRPHGDRPCIILHFITGPHNLPSVHITHNKAYTDAWMPSQMCPSEIIFNGMGNGLSNIHMTHSTNVHHLEVLQTLTKTNL